MPSGSNPIYVTRARISGATIELHDARLIGVRGEGEHRWVVYCVVHNQSTSFARQADAYKAMTSPTWCTGCNAAIETGTPISVSQQRRLAVQTRREQEKVEKDAERDALMHPPKDPDEMTAGELLAANLCFECHGPLRGSDGHFHNKGAPARDVCCECFGHDDE